MSQKYQAQVAIIMGSKTDWEIMKAASEALKEFRIRHEVKVLSAHRAPSKLIEYVNASAEKGVSVFLCGAGGAAHLAGVVAAHTILPVIGVPVSSGALKGMDALLSTVQMPKGIPVATVAVDGAYNAAVLAVEILAVHQQKLKIKLRTYKKEMEKKVLASSDSLQSHH
ncbi:MAG: 5-(carboxyamino)imidazole ribonucleotide mutase [Candidatus Aureabacteria bacterium]|nr:5-(carboxyamino)imidazole ribonucleotide mutase [Candidatus Auribacterota bacterium]